MPEKKGGSGWLKWGLIAGAIIFIILAIVALYFVFAVPSMVEVDKEGVPLAPQLPEVGLRMAMIFGVIIVGLVFIAGIIFVLWEILFKKRELHIVKEHHKIIRESAALNPVSTLGNLVMTGANKIQSYNIGKIVGYTQIPVNFERFVYVNASGKIEEEFSESFDELKERKQEALAAGRDKYDFFAFVCKKGFYALPFFSMLEPPKILACYPAERTPDLVGDVEIYDVGTWKLSGVNIFVPGQRHQEPKITLHEMEGQLFPIAHMSLVDYIGLVAQRGIEGDTSMQKWLQAKASTVNVKEGGE